MGSASGMGPRVAGRHLFLTGYRGTGKTSVGRILAERLGRPLIDVDEWIVRRDGRTIAMIFADGGEAEFRELESWAIEEIAQQPAAVVALGGGSILRESNRRIIASGGFCVWLDASPETLGARIEADAATGDQRPSLSGRGVGEEVRQVMRDREPLYRAASDHRIDTGDRPIEEIVREILAVVGGEGG